MLERHPEPRPARPDPGNARPDLRNARHDPGNACPDLRNARPDPGNARPDLRNARPDPGNARPDLRNARPDPRNARPDSCVSDPLPGARSPDLRNRVPKLRARSPRCRSGAPESRVGTPFPWLSAPHFRARSPWLWCSVLPLRVGAPYLRVCAQVFRATSRGVLSSSRGFRTGAVRKAWRSARTSACCARIGAPRRTRSRSPSRNSSPSRAPREPQLLGGYGAVPRPTRTRRKFIRFSYGSARRPRILLAQRAVTFEREGGEALASGRLTFPCARLHRGSSPGLLHSLVLRPPRRALAPEGSGTGGRPRAGPLSSSRPARSRRWDGRSPLHCPGPAPRPLAECLASDRDLSRVTRLAVEETAILSRIVLQVRHLLWHELR